VPPSETVAKLQRPGAGAEDDLLVTCNIAGTDIIFQLSNSNKYHIAISSIIDMRAEK
jgi:hypothetical protein